MNRIQNLIREPALLIDAFESLVVFFVAIGLFGLHGDQQEYLVAAFIAVLGLAKGFLTHPFPVTVVPDLGRALLVLFASFGAVHLSADQITIAVTMLGTVMTLVARSQITPVYDSITRPGGAGAGPLAGERGAVDVLALVGLVLLVIGLLLIVFKGMLVLGIVLAIVGVLLLAFGGYNRGSRLR